MKKPRIYMFAEPLIALMVLVFALMTPAYATERLAVLELTGDAAPDEVMYQLSDSLRAGALEALAGSDIDVMTRESIAAILGDMGLDVACIEGQCEVETARNLRAAYVVSGGIVSIEGTLLLSVKLHDAGSGSLLGTDRLRARGGVLDFIDQAQEVGYRLVVDGLGLTPSGRGAIGSGPVTGTEGRIGGGGGLDLGSSSNVAIVTFESEPAGAVVLVDNQLVCPSTPCTRDVRPGAHRVTMQAERYHSSEERVSVSGDDTVSMTLSPAFGLLSVVTTPRGLPIKVNGEAVGANVQAIELSAGTYEVVVESDCYGLAGERIVLNEGDNRSVTISPPLREAGLDLRLSDESGNTLRGRVFADDTEIGRAPGRMAVPVCHEELRVEADGGLGWRGELELVENEVRSHELTLEAGGAAGGGPAGITWVRIPSGTFQMGSTSGESDERPVHSVTLDAFEMSATEVTVAQYRLCVDAGVCRAPDGNYNFSSQYDNHPVTKVSWTDATTFATWAGGSLPTEAQWEYAALGGQSYTYAGSNSATNVGWVSANSGSRTHEVAQLRANGYGLYDMTGNVAEWVSDFYSNNYYSQSPRSNPENTSNASYLVFRGGSWRHGASRARVASRGGSTPSGRYGSIGFRLAR
jgi:formylglycine-generating enzyme